MKSRRGIALGAIASSLMLSVASACFDLSPDPTFVRDGGATGLDGQATAEGGGDGASSDATSSDAQGPDGSTIDAASQDATVDSAAGDAGIDASVGDAAVDASSDASMTPDAPDLDTSIPDASILDASTTID